MEPLRGEVWDAHLPRLGDHPVVVLTVNLLIPKLSAVTAAVVTGTEGPPQTHVALGKESGLTRYDVSYANVTDIHTISKASLRCRRGILHTGEFTRLEEAIRTYLGL